ncbi:hypothetical protein GCM10027597_10940 [Saccharopolyspora tripterygii]
MLGFALFPKWPSLLPSAPSYATVPDPCKAVPKELLDATFQDNAPRMPERDDHSFSYGDRVSCEWIPYSDQADVLGRYSYLTVEVAAHLSSTGRPDAESVDDEFVGLPDSKPFVPVRGLGDRAVLNVDEDTVTILASRANLTVKVRYDSVVMTPPPDREEAIPVDQLKAEGRRIAEAVLAAAGEPE